MSDRIKFFTADYRGKDVYIGKKKFPIGSFSVQLLNQFYVDDLGLRICSMAVENFLITDAFEKAGDYTYFYTCGPMPMFRAVNKATTTSGQFSFEERMGCGFGACMGCTCKTKYGNKRICKDGPVLVKEEIIW